MSPSLIIIQSYQAGNAASSVSASASSLTAQASDAAMRKLDDSKDYVYSTWDDNKIRYDISPLLNDESYSHLHIH